MRKSHATDKASAQPTSDQLKELFAQISSGRVTRDGLQGFLRGGGFQPTLSQKRARARMEGNFFGVEEAIKYFGVEPTEKQLAALANIPWQHLSNFNELLIAIFPLSIADLLDKTELLLIHEASDRHYGELFAQDRGEVGWHRICKNLVDNSTARSLREQLAVCPKAFADLDYKRAVPSARVVVYAMLGHFLATGKRLFENVDVRCSDITGDGQHAVVGFSKDSIYISTRRDDARENDLGLVLEDVMK